MALLKYAKITANGTAIGDTPTVPLLDTFLFEDEGDETAGTVAVDNVLRRSLRVSDPADPAAEVEFLFSTPDDVPMPEVQTCSLFDCEYVA